MRICSYDGIGISAPSAVPVNVENDAAQVFEVDLVNDARIRWHDPEILKCRLAPAQERIAFLIALKLYLVIEIQCIGSPVIIDLYGMVDDQFGGGQRVDLVGGAAQLDDGISHGGEVNHRRNASEVLQDDAARRKRNLRAGIGFRVPVGQSEDVVARNDSGDEPWYVVDKDLENNVLVVVQGESDLLLSRSLLAADPSWIGAPPAELADGLRCKAKVRYRQSDQDCTVTSAEDNTLRVDFDEPQRAVAPGQFVVFYAAERCLGGSAIICALQPAGCS